MPSKDPTARELERQARELEQLIEEAQRIHREVSAQLGKLRRERPSIDRVAERPKKPR